MELKQQLVKKCDEKIRVFSQITFDDDCIVKDNMPDVVKIICATGTAELEENRVVSEAIWITGKIHFEVMYRSDKEGQLPEVIRGTVPFQEKVMVKDIEETDQLQIFFRVEDVAASIINSRKFALRGLVTVEVLVEDVVEDKIAYGLMEDQNAQIKLEEEQMLNLLSTQHDVVRIHNELNLPKLKPNVSRIVCYYLDICNKKCVVKNHQLELTGDAHICLLYMSEEQQPEWYDEVMSFTGAVNCSVGDNPDLYWVRSELQQHKIEAELDYDKEMRQFSCDLIFDVNVKAWMEEVIPVMRDVYFLDKNIELKYQPVTIWNYLVKNEAKFRLAEQIHMDSAQEKILQICGCKSDVEIEHSQVVEQGIRIEGVLIVDILYITMNDGFPIGHRREQLPFEEIIDVAGIGEETKYELQCGLDQLQVNLLDNLEYEIKAGISVEALVLKKNEIKAIIDSEIVPLQEEEGDTPGIVGYIVQKDEELWDIAKKYQTTMEEIVESNGMSCDKVKEGDRIIITIQKVQKTQN